MHILLLLFFLILLLLAENVVLLLLDLLRSDEVGLLGTELLLNLVLQVLLLRVEELVQLLELS